MRAMVIFTIVIAGLFGVGSALYIAFMNRLRAQEVERARLARQETGTKGAPRS